MFENSVRAWSRGTNYVNITDEQYAKLKQGRVSKPPPDARLGVFL
jgi:hypothetical protein